MNALFSYRQSKKLAEIATDYVRVYRQERLTKLESAKIFLVGPSSPIRLMIVEAAKKGQVEINVDFQELNKGNKFSCVDHLFVDEELDQLIICVAAFLEKEGFNHTVINQSIIMTWPDPLTIQSDPEVDNRQDLSICEQTNQ